MTPSRGWEQASVYALGHSTRTLDEFIELLQAHEIEVLADVRSLPGSKRLPHFDKENLEIKLPEVGIEYRHLPLLGGLRKSHKHSPNTAWHNASFRSYADYMGTESFEEGLESLRKLTLSGRVALMCAEAVPWRCHRSLIADALYARGVLVHQISSKTKADVHRPTAFAVFDGTHVTYPPSGDGVDALVP